MGLDLIRALLAGAAGAVLPGYFWAAVLRPTSGLGERLAYSTVVSMASVPTIAVILARAAHTGVVLWVALASVLIVFGSGLLVYRFRGPAPGSAAPVLRIPDRVRDPRVLGLGAAGQQRDRDQRQQGDRRAVRGHQHQAGEERRGNQAEDPRIPRWLRHSQHRSRGPRCRALQPEGDQSRAEHDQCRS